MARSSGSKEQMIEAGRELVRERGYSATSFGDVLARSKTSRGSVYFNFPGGKEELGAEVLIAHAARSISDINRAAVASHTAADLVQAYLEHVRDELAENHFQQGCALAALVMEGGSSGHRLATLASQGLADVVNTLSRRLVERGLEWERAQGIAYVVLSAAHGAVTLARSEGCGRAFEPVIALIPTLTG